MECVQLSEKFTERTDVSSCVASLAPMPRVDHSAFGPTHQVKLSRIQQLTAKFLGRNWVTIPHVTHHDDVDVTQMESRRGEWNDAHSDSKLTPVVLLVRALGKVLRDFPDFNASLGDAGATMVLNDSVHVGVAVDPPSGPLVPVLRHVARSAEPRVG